VPRAVAGNPPSSRARRGRAPEAGLTSVLGGRRWLAPADAAPAGGSRQAALAGCLLLLVVAGCAHGPRQEAPGEEGEASWYGPGLYGRKTASGEVLRPGTLTAAHRTLPFGTCLRVTNLENGRTVEVRVNDRGPYAAGRILDVSETAARALGMRGRGVTRVRLDRCSGNAELDVPVLEAAPEAAVARAQVEETDPRL
jgi:rare lipoprotein A (peptidoglycan hydrolase)